MLLLKSVDYGRMAEILVQRAASPDEFTRLTAITWVSKSKLSFTYGVLLLISSIWGQINALFTFIMFE